jgi:tetratricopeptide (TPR) repeat protein
MQRHDEALAQCNRDIGLNPGDALAFVRRGETYRRLKRYGEALADLKRLRKLIGSGRPVKS